MTRNEMEKALMLCRDELLGPLIDGKHHVSPENFYKAYQAQALLIGLVSGSNPAPALNFLVLQGRITDDDPA